MPVKKLMRLWQTDDICIRETGDFMAYTVESHNFFKIHHKFTILIRIVYIQANTWISITVGGRLNFSNPA